jgi:type IV secretory pathway TraG/TraD family ATPase VirD4
MPNIVQPSTIAHRTAASSVPPRVRNELPLGTAAWHAVDGRFVRQLQAGDFFLGRTSNGRAVGFNDDRHVFVCSNARGGKGASLIIPNLIDWRGSTVVLDPKGENAMVTARRRANGSQFCTGMGHKVHILDPFNTVGTRFDDFSDLKASFNPLDCIHPAREESIDEAARIADALVVSEDSKDAFWEESARGLLKAVILHVGSSPNYTANERNLVTVRRLVVAGDAEMAKFAAVDPTTGEKPSSFALLFHSMKRNPAFSGIVSDAGEQFANQEVNSPRAFTSILQVACTNTDFIDSPGMRRCLTKSDFALSELKTNSTGMSLYICLPQRFMNTHFRWLRMMVTLGITEMERVKHQPNSGHPVLMVLDEFPALRRMKVIENAAAQIAGFGVKLMFVVQTLAQIRDVYRDNWETLLANCGVKSFFCNDDHFTREYVSKLIGDCEVVRMSANESHAAGWSSNRSTGTSNGMSVTNSVGVSSGFSSGGQNSSSSYGMNFGQAISMSTGTNSSSSEGSNASTSRGLSETIQKRALITPDEIGRLFGDRDRPASLVLVSGCQPMALKRTYYFNEKLAGYYDAHADHALPLTLTQIHELKAQQDRAAAWERAQKMITEADFQEEVDLREQEARDSREQSLKSFWKNRTLARIGLDALPSWESELRRRQGRFRRLLSDFSEFTRLFLNHSVNVEASARKAQSTKIMYQLEYWNKTNPFLRFPHPSRSAIESRVREEMRPGGIPAEPVRPSIRLSTGR